MHSTVLRRGVLVVAVAVAAWVGLGQRPQAQAPAAGGTVALTNVRVIDGTGAAPIERATVGIADGRIQEIGRAHV